MNLLGVLVLLLNISNISFRFVKLSYRFKMLHDVCTGFDVLGSFTDLLYVALWL